MSMLLNLPEEVHNEIFLRVPAESVLSSRCVCKPFYNLLSKPIFIKNHVNRTIHQLKNSKPKLLFGHRSKEESCDDSLGDQYPMIYSVPIDYDSISSSCKRRGAVCINYPFEPNKMYQKSFLGSVNGLICFKFDSFEPSESRDNLPSFSYAQHFCILNPLTGEYKEFQHPRFNLCINYRYVYGFGYDNNIDDYKLVAMVYDKPDCLEIDVYTLKSDTWTSIQEYTDHSFYKGRDNSHAVFTCGCLHWLGTTKIRETWSVFMVSFDVSTETIVDMPLPADIDCLGKVYRNIGLWGDCLCIARISDSDRLDVWVMEEYGVKESWTKRFTTTTKLSGSSNPYWKPLWCFDNGEILVDSGGKQLHLYDTTNERVRSVSVSGITMDGNRESYAESLASLGSGNYLEKRITDGIVKNLERLTCVKDV